MDERNHGAEDMAGDVCPNEGVNIGGDEGSNEEVSQDANEGNQNPEQAEEVNEPVFVEPPHPPAPDAPSRDEWLKHQITHVPFKAWCPICVKNAAINNPHKLTHLILFRLVEIQDGCEVRL